MKQRGIEIIGMALAILTMYGIIVLTKPFQTLLSMNIPLLLIACCLFAASLFLWSAIWVYIVTRSDLLPEREINGRLQNQATNSKTKAIWKSHTQIFSVSMASLIGFLTPMNVGTDILRSFLGKRHLNLPLKLTAASSVITRTYKLHVTLLLVIILIISYTSVLKNYMKTLIIPVASIVSLLIILYSLRTEPSARLSKRLKIGDISETIKKLDSRLGIIERTLIYLFFVIGFVLEWLSLHSCFLALNLKSTLSVTFVLFLLLYFLSRTPFSPQGLGIVEIGGFVLLKTMEVSTAQIGALLVVWDFFRVFIPVFLFAVFSINLIKAKSKHIQSIRHETRKF